MDDNDVTASLEAMQQTRDKLADRMQWPLWRHAATGVLLAVVLFGIALPGGKGALVNVLVLVAAVAIMAHDKKTHGMFVSGYQRGRTGWVIAALIGLWLAALVATLAMEAPLANPLFWAIEASLFVAGTALSVLWGRVYRADLRSGRS